MLLQIQVYQDAELVKSKYLVQQLLGVQRVLTEANGKEWLVSSWMWEGLRKDKGVETKGFQERNV